MFTMLMKWMQRAKVLPRISDTERQALEAGHVWIDGEIFGGNPDFKKMLRANYAALTPEEQEFLDGPVEELLRRADSYAISRSRRVPEALMEFMRQQGFFGLIVPKEYGGLGFSALARSAVMAKVAPHSGILSAYVIIPNTLGAAELLIEYGTPAQKQHYLPKLARGEYVPCFGLTEPTAGSDAASIEARGDVFQNDAGEIQIRLNFRKRYITLAPVANLISLACRLHDPENLLGKGTSPGITVVLVHRGTPGLIQGDRHEPIGDAFPNGPLIGNDVVVSADNIIGESERAGDGWKMLMEQLAGGRMVSLPAGAVGGIRLLAAATGAYSMVRQQFGMPIGHMEGIEDKIGKLAALSYLCEGARVFGCSAVNDGIHPPVTSAVLKAYTTELARQAVTDAMDVFSGSGVMQGPNNLVARGYSTAPVGITVEGANIMTRTLIIFGQGATRCHPHVLPVIQAVEGSDVAKFRTHVVGWIGHFFGGMARNFVRGITRGWTVRVPNVAPETRAYYRRLGWAATRFGLLTDLALFFIGDKLKARGRLTGRYADAVAWMLLGFAALRRFEAEGRRREDLPLVHYSLQYALTHVQEAFEGIYENFDGPLGAWLRVVWLPILRMNRLSRRPSDALSRAAARIVQRYDAQARRLMEGCFISADETRHAGRLFKAFRLVTEAGPVIARIQRAQQERRLPRGAAEEMVALAENQGIISRDEAALVNAAHTARLHAIEVDSFTETEFFANAAVPPATPALRASSF